MTAAVGGSTAGTAGEGVALNFLPSRQFVSWLHESRLSLVLTTYQAGKLFLVGSRDSEHLSVFERTFNRCMGLHATSDCLVLSSLYQIWRLENALQPGEVHGGYDRLYVPRLGYVTGDLDIHDVTVDASGRIVFVNTLFSCLATVSDKYSFTPIWSPPFITRLAAEDRCHLNGLALRDGRPRYVTAVSTTDVGDGWREHRRDGGVVIDVDSGECVASGLSMPHSPRWYRDRLWLLDSGNGNFGFIDMVAGRFEPVAFCPGYLRGLSFAGDYAVAGLSKARDTESFGGLNIASRLADQGVASRCGLFVIDLRTGDAVHWLRIDGVVEELYDVAVLEGVRRPMALGFKTDEIRRLITVGPGN